MLTPYKTFTNAATEHQWNKIKINSDFISSIVLDKIIDIKIAEELIDDFVYFYFGKKSVFTEKIRNKNKFCAFLQKKFEIETSVKTDRFTNEHYVFKSIPYNVVTMNNGDSFFTFT